MGLDLALVAIVFAAAAGIGGLIRPRRGRRRSALVGCCSSLPRSCPARAPRRADEAAWRRVGQAPLHLVAVAQVGAASACCKLSVRGRRPRSWRSASTPGRARPRRCGDGASGRSVVLEFGVLAVLGLVVGAAPVPAEARRRRIASAALALTPLTAGATTRRPRPEARRGLPRLSCIGEHTTLMALGDTETTTRQRRQLADTAIAQATQGEWEAAVETNRELLELGPDIDAYNRLGKALAELGRHDEALDAYEKRARARRHQPDRRAQRGATARAAGRRCRHERQRQAGEGIGRRLHRGDGKDRPRPAHQRRGRRVAGAAVAWRCGRAVRWTGTCWWRASARSIGSGRAARRRPAAEADGGRQPLRGGDHRRQRAKGAEDHHPRGVRPPATTSARSRSPAARRPGGGVGPYMKGSAAPLR